MEKIHLIAHSRGTDVAVAAMRELSIASWAAGIDPRERYKIHNFVLAAPDLDVQVATQRIVGDKLSLSARRLTVYTSPEDKAIGVASRLFQSPRGRLGRLGPDDAGGLTQRVLEYGNSNLAFVNFVPDEDALQVVGDKYGHSYFRNAPTVASDLVLTLRDDLDPGAPGRPLVPLGDHFWAVPPGYPGMPEDP